MKIGILTFHNTINYGAQLQSYALYQTLRAMGHDVAIANYRNAAVSARETPSVPNPLKGIRHPRTALRSIWSYNPSLRRREKFLRFAHDKVKTSNELLDQGDISRHFDTIVVGSDQVWNPRCTKGDLTYFLNGPECNMLRKVSYAASFGSADFPKEFAKRCGNAIKEFDSVSVRETTGVDIVKSIAGRHAELVLDPTLLLDRAHWTSLASPPATKKEYVFAYIVAERANTLKYARAIAQARNAELVVLDCYGSAIPPLGNRFCNDASLEDFLSLILNSTLTVTSSFHGLALSLALGAQVCYSLNKSTGSRNSRLESLASIAGIEGHNIMYGPPKTDIDYAKTDAQIALAREKSLSYLRTALG